MPTPRWSRSAPRTCTTGRSGHVLARREPTRAPPGDALGSRLERVRQTLAMRDLLEYRSEFPILEHTTYLVSHSLGAMPRRVTERVAEFARMWQERGIRAWA